MDDNSNDKLDSLEHTLRTLRFQQQRIDRELDRVSAEIESLKKNTAATPSADPVEAPDTIQAAGETIHTTVPAKPVFAKKIVSQTFTPHVRVSGKKLEDLIGTNIINKIGILITVVGVFIGVKYAIDKELISPATRVVSGYALAIGLLAIAKKLKTKYHDFSSVIMSGGVTILYFITFIAYDFYDLFPQGVAFFLMVATTALAVWMALWYNRKIIALLGQVGAYAVPFLLSDGSGKVLVLFAYVSIINGGLLVLSVKKDWKLIYRSAFAISWLIFLLTITIEHVQKDHFALQFIFLTLNFLVFYAAFLSYKILKKEMYQLGEIVVLLINAFVFFLIGYQFISHSFANQTYLTIFTLANAVVHLAVGLWIRRMRLVDASVVVFVLGLGISFITVAVPIAFSNTWITMLWVVEATVLCFIGYQEKRNLYLLASFSLVVLTLISLLMDWSTHSQVLFRTTMPQAVETAFANIDFVNATLVCGCLAAMSWIAVKNRNAVTEWTGYFFSMVLPVLFIGLLYINILIELDLWWLGDYISHHYVQAANFQTLWVLIYSMLYAGAWLFLNQRYMRKSSITLLMAVVSVFCMFGLFTEGLNAIGWIRESYLQHHTGRPLAMLGIRYMCFAAVALLLAALKKNQLAFFNSLVSARAYSMLFNIALLTVICNEFVHWMDVMGYNNQYKLGLSIICGLYALVLIAIGILRKRKYLRIAAMVLLGSTLLKLFFYDLASLSTISKTIVLIILGIILLVASFLYNKFKHTLFEEPAEERTGGGSR